jgi:hypothetical protein
MHHQVAGIDLELIEIVDLLRDGQDVLVQPVPAGERVVVIEDQRGGELAAGERDGGDVAGAGEAERERDRVRRRRLGVVLPVGGGGPLRVAGGIVPGVGGALARQRCDQDAR